MATIVNRRGVISVACVLIGGAFTYLMMSSTTAPTTTTTGLPIKTGVYLNFDTTKYTNRDGQIFIPTDAVLEQMSFAELEELYYRYIEIIQIVCPRTRHIGGDEDGGYHVCETVLPNECLAYSFGSRKDYTFDDGLAAHYKCEVHTFDPDDGQVDHKHGELVTFHKSAIGEKDGTNTANWTIRTLDTTLKFLGHSQRSLDLLKLDAEGAEWVSLPEILKSKTLDKAHVKLLIVEFHMHERFTGRTRDAYMLGLRILRDIYDVGFRIYYFRIWSHFCLTIDKVTHKERANCHEVHFMRK